MPAFLSLLLLENQLDFSATPNATLKEFPKSGRAVLVFLPGAENINQLLGLYSSWEYAVQGVLDIDLIVVHSQSIALPAVMKSSSSRTGGPDVLSVFCERQEDYLCAEEIVSVLGNYTHVFKTVVASVLGGTFAAWNPKTFQMNNNLENYAGTLEKHEQITTLSQAMGLYHG
jgi:hypothetical protein